MVRIPIRSSRMDRRRTRTGRGSIRSRTRSMEGTVAEDTVAEDTVAEGTVAEDSVVAEDTVAEDTVAEGTVAGTVVGLLVACSTVGTPSRGRASRERDWDNTMVRGDSFRYFPSRFRCPVLQQIKNTMFGWSQCLSARCRLPASEDKE